MKVAILIFSLCFSVSMAYTQTKPNIIYILADDMGQNMLGRNNPEYNTPNIDQLANEGKYFERAYTMAACSPTRAALLSGVYPMRFGLNYTIVQKDNWDRTIPDEYVWLPEAMRNAGYQTGMVGKWHIGNNNYNSPRMKGFDYSFEMVTGGADYYTHETGVGTCESYTINENGICQNDLADTYVTDLFTEKALEFIEGAGQTKNPFFLYLPYTEPHTPLQCPGMPELVINDTTPLQDITDILVCKMEQLDNAVRLIVDKVDQLGIRDNTLIVFQSDNGAIAKYQEGNLPYRDKKGSFYEGGVNTPLIFNWLGTIVPGVVPINQPVHIVDIYPTFQELANGQIGNDFDGISLVPYFGGANIPARTICLNAITGRNVAVAYKEWSLVSHAVLNAPTQTEVQTPIAGFPDYELYNLDLDISQANNLFGTGQSIENQLVESADVCMSYYNFVPYLDDDANWCPPIKNYRHNVHNTDFWKDQYKPIEFLNGNQ